MSGLGTKQNLVEAAGGKMNAIELSNKNGVPISTVGELRSVLEPFTDDCPVNDISVFYIGSDSEGAKLSLRPSNTQMQTDADVCDCQFVDMGFCPYCKPGAVCANKTRR